MPTPPAVHVNARSRAAGNRARSQAIRPFVTSPRRTHAAHAGTFLFRTSSPADFFVGAYGGKPTLRLVGPMGLAPPALQQWSSGHPRIRGPRAAHATGGDKIVGLRQSL